MKSWSPIAMAAAATVLAAAASQAGAVAVNVDAQANIYAAGLADTSGFSAGGLLPVSIALGAGSTSVVFDSVVAGSPVSGSPSGGATCVFNGLASSGDGSTCVSSVSDVFSANGYSAYYLSGRTMTLVGVFVGATKSPTAPAGNPMSFADANTATGFSPLLQQVFFIGDGRTAADALQTFAVPTGATTLYLGFADAYGFYGAPGAYTDNYGSLDVSLSVAAVPEPATLMMSVLGLAALLPLARRARRAR
jgi:hypothetical protein